MTSPGWALTKAPGAQGGGQARTRHARELRGFWEDKDPGGPQDSRVAGGNAVGIPATCHLLRQPPLLGRDMRRRAQGEPAFVYPGKLAGAASPTPTLGAAFVHRLLTFPCRVTAHTDRRPTGSSVTSQPPTERSLKGSGSCWGSSSEGI